MATIGENIEAMAALVSKVKKDHHLTENTVLRIVDMNFALAQGGGLPSFSGDEQMPNIPGLEDGVDLDSGIREQVLAFPGDFNPTEDEPSLATVEHKKED